MINRYHTQNRFHLILVNNPNLISTQLENKFFSGFSSKLKKKIIFRHEFHKSCIDPWLLEHRTCPMCKMDILKHYGFVFTSSQESILQIDAERGEVEESGDFESLRVRLCKNVMRKKFFIGDFAHVKKSGRVQI